MSYNLETLEEASNLCHIEWMDWSKSITKELKEVVKLLEDNIQYMEDENLNDNNKTEELSKKNKLLSQKINDRIQRWESLWIPYEDLSEEMKEYDRVYAKKILKLTQND